MPGGDWRETTFVEIGPVTAFSRAAAAELLPFPKDLKMGWGLDVHWAAVAQERGWRIGVVDATPIGHTLRPAAADYPRETAAAEARRFLDGRPYVPRDAVRTLARTGSVSSEGPGRRRVLPARSPTRRSGIWAHRQALAARDHGAEVRVVVLHRPIAPAARFARPAPRGARSLAPAATRPARRPRRPLPAFVSPPRGRSYASLGRVRRARPGAASCAASAASSPMTWSTPTTRCPPPTPSCAPATARRW